jgi:hypothetical protein
MKDKRKYMRFTAYMDIFYELMGRQPLNKKARLINVSKEGIRITDEKALLKGANIDMEIKIPGQSAYIPAFAEVVWSKSFDEAHCSTGMRFTKIQKKDRVKLLDYAYDEWLKTQRQTAAA